MHTCPYDYVAKVIVVGEASVGKTSLSSRLSNKEYNAAYDVTIGVDFVSMMHTHENRTFRYHFWDTAGQEMFRSIARSYYKNSATILLVYDVTDRASFEKIRTWWYEDIATTIDVQHLSILLLANKVDKAHHRVVTFDEGQLLSSSIKATYIETSARTGEGVERILPVISAGLLRGIDNGTIDTRDERSGVRCMHSSVNVGATERLAALEKSTPSIRSCCDVA